MKNDTRIDRWGVLSLALSRGVTNIPIVVLGLVLIEIADTFNVSVGMAGQLTTAFAIVAILFSLIMGILAVRYDHRELLLLGLGLYVIVAAAVYLVGSFPLLILILGISGVATAVVISMPNALIGELLPVERRTGAYGITLVVVALMFLLGAPATDMISSNYGWRSAMFWVMTPITLLTLGLVAWKIPKGANVVSSSGSLSEVLSGLKEVAKSTSALACLIGTILGMATFNVFLVYGASFWRQAYSVSSSFVSLVIVFTSTFYIVGCVVTAPLTNRLGRKPLTVASTIACAIFTIAAINSPDIWWSLLFSLTGCLVGGIMGTVSTSLTAEQVPKQVGAMMSAHSAAINMGAMVASIIGGFMIVSFGYSIFGVVMGVAGVLGALVFQWFSVDPTKPKVVKSSQP